MKLFEVIKSKVKMEEVLDSYGIHPITKNMYCCPFHGDKNPSATIIKDNDKFHCFAENETWDIFDIVQKMEHCSSKKAIQILDEKFKLGLGKGLTAQERKEILDKQREREIAKMKKLKKQQFERDVCDKILEKIKMWEKIQKQTHLTRGEYKKGEWEFSTLFFEALKQQRKLYWLYDTICGFDNPLCEYDFIYGNKNDVLKKIEKGEIII